ncbi:cytochrome c [Rhodocytophaga rosea]|uniref:Cytochrome c n=1 Tax=Rhodocytophaga rosea TaxID=2704465 RepID=A0A6C0GL19_9BACT|nr:cytochrome c [Rhodocytophaga rosea]QHT68340.1 cytochrome c [Rhodocytophaga rosea]
MKIDNPKANELLFKFCLFFSLLIAVSCSSENKTEGNEASNTTEENTSSAPAAQPEAVPVADQSKGIGPVSNVNVGADIDKTLAGQGKTIFESKCAACHKLNERYVGPPLGGVTQRRKPEWIMNMILNPQEMVQKNDTAQALLSTYMTQMPNQNLTQEEARAMLEYFRQADSEPKQK